MSAVSSCKSGDARLNEPPPKPRCTRARDILSEITTTPTPSPSPQGGGEHTECLATAAIYCIGSCDCGEGEPCGPGPRLELAREACPPLRHPGARLAGARERPSALRPRRSRVLRVCPRALGECLLALHAGARDHVAPEREAG